MTLYVKNKLVSLGGSSIVFDENEAQVFQVKGKVMSPTNKKFVCDTNGNVLFTVRDKFFHFITKKALIYGADGKKYCKVKERFFGRVTDVVDCEDDIRFESNGFAKGISIFKNDEKIGAWFVSFDGVSSLVRDCYRVDVYNESDAALLVALVIAIDNIRDKRRED